MNDKGFPIFTDRQVSALEKLYPPRCIRRNENAEDHLRYAGMVDLIAMMRSHVPEARAPIGLTVEEEEDLDDEAIAIAEAQQRGDS